MTPREQIRTIQQAVLDRGGNVGISGSDGVWGDDTFSGVMDMLARIPEKNGAKATAIGIIPTAWLQKVPMKRIIAHWTAGSYTVSSVDRDHYHFIVSGAGEIVKGDHDVSDNVNTADNDYAAHTRGCNSGSIGISLACMAGARESPFDPGSFPMTQVQWNAMIRAISQLCVFYGIQVTPETVLSHAEVQGTLGIKQAGKWDFTRLAFDNSLKGAKACGDRMRMEVKTMVGE